MVQDFKYLGIRIKASGVFTRGVADLRNKTLNEGRVYAKTKYFRHQIFIPTFCFTAVKFGDPTGTGNEFSGKRRKRLH